MSAFAFGADSGFADAASAGHEILACLILADDDVPQLAGDGVAFRSVLHPLDGDVAGGSR